MHLVHHRLSPITNVTIAVPSDSARRVELSNGSRTRVRSEGAKPVGSQWKLVPSPGEDGGAVPLYIRHIAKD